MPHYLAVDWDENEVRFLLGSLKNDRLTVLKAGAAPIGWDDSPGGTVPDATTSGDTAFLQSLHALLKEHRVEKCRTMLVLGRWQLDLYPMILPNAPDTEMPGMVKNQVLREAGTFNEVDPVDYLVVGRAGQDSRRVIAAAISAVRRQKWVAAFRAFGYPLGKIVYRGAAAAELLTRSRNIERSDTESEAESLFHESDAASLLVTVVGKEAELVLLAGRDPLAFRAFKIPEAADETETVERIAAEIVRTVAVGFPEQDGVRAGEIQTVFHYGDATDNARLAAKLAPHNLTVRTFDPFAVDGITCREHPENPARFASLLGAVLAALPGRRPAFDLLAPKEKPKPPNIARRIVFATLLLLIGGYALYQWNASVLDDMKREAAALEEQVQELVKGIDGVRAPYIVLTQTRGWDNAGANWLDELRDISVLFPGADDLMITQMTFHSGPIRGNPNITGEIQLRGMVRDPSVLQTLQQGLARNRYHRMHVPTPTRNPAGGGYPWLFTATIDCARRPSPATYLNALPAGMEQPLPDNRGPRAPAP